MPVPAAVGRQHVFVGRAAAHPQAIPRRIHALGRAIQVQHDAQALERGGDGPREFLDELKLAQVDWFLAPPRLWLAYHKMAVVALGGEDAANRLIENPELMNASAAQASGVRPLARVAGYVTYANEPERYTTAVIGSIRKLLDRTGWTVGDVDLFEVNEAFAVVPMAVMRDVGVDRARLNVNGGACALGHPIGATGARIVTTLIHALRKRGGRRGIAALCLGGGEAVAMALEIP